MIAPVVTHVILANALNHLTVAKVTLIVNYVGTATTVNVLKSWIAAPMIKIAKK